MAEGLDWQCRTTLDAWNQDGGTASSAAVDRHVGVRIRSRRMLAGLSRQQLGEQIGASFEQMLKYERGGSSVGASRLYRIAAVLDVPVWYFFDGLPLQANCDFTSDIFRKEAVRSEAPRPSVGDRELMRLVSAFKQVPDAAQRRSVLSLIELIASRNDDAGGNS